jgi:hypothetical protein
MNNRIERKDHNDQRDLEDHESPDGATVQRFILVS